MSVLKRKAEVCENGDLESAVVQEDGVQEAPVLDSGVQVADEYDEDSSDEEDVVNTIGDVPLRWYDDFDHVGYTREGVRLARGKTRGEIEQFLQRVSNPEFWRTVLEKSSGREHVLSDEELQLVERVSGSRAPLSSTDMEPIWLDFFSGQVMKTPLSARPEHKRSFLPSRSEALKVSELVGKMKQGLISLEKPEQKPTQPRFYMLWKEDGTTDEMRRLIRPQRAPKPALPGHELSYRPPPEYVPLEGVSEERVVTPKSHKNLRSVAAYSNLVSEQFERCLSLYLCPRKTVVKTRLQGPEQLLPPLPDRRELQPYPTRCALVFRGHENAVRCLAVSADGQLVVSGSDDGSLRVWEASSGRCLQTCRLAADAGVTAVAWNPSPRLRLIAASCGRHVYLVVAQCGDAAASACTRSLLAARPQEPRSQHARAFHCRWRVEKDEQRRAGGVVAALSLAGTCRQLEWHPAGDYLVSVVPEAGNTSVMVHQLSRWRSQMPFTKSQRAQAARFHPLRPYLFIATLNHVRVFNLATQRLTRKLSAGVKWVSSLAIHPGGDNVVIGSYDHRVHWFDLDLSTSPCHRLRYHGLAVRQVAFHKRYPLLSSAGDDNKIMVFHAKVSSDLNQQAQVVPVKMLRGHDKCEELCVLDLAFHPEQPWLFSAGADGTIRLWV